jgi:hypothetical protein
MKSDLRSLAVDIYKLAKNNPAYSQIYEVVRVITDHINAIAYIEEMHGSDVVARQARVDVALAKRLAESYLENARLRERIKILEEELQQKGTKE